MTKEEKYTAQLKQLGIWEPAFAPAVHDLCILEREQARTRKAWKAAAAESEDAAFNDPLYGVIMKQGEAIQRMREALGLTPKGLRRFRRDFGAGKPEAANRPKTILELVREKSMTG